MNRAYYNKNTTDFDKNRKNYPDFHRVVQMRLKLISVIAVAVLTTATAYMQVSFGVRAGVNLQNINGENDAGGKLKNKLKPGFHAGVEVAFPIAQDFYLQPGLFFSAKGAADRDEVKDNNLSISYLELPIHLVYKPQLGTGKIILGFGPYLAYGISGKIKFTGGEKDIVFTNDAEEEESDYALKPFDAGADIFFGYEFAFKLYAQINAQLGLLNLSPDVNGETQDIILKNTGFGLSLGYRF
jgi:hypothetical protein